MKKIYRIAALIIPLSLSLLSAGQRAEISSFSTSVADQDEDVKRNIHIGSGKISGTAIGPNSVFSFNNTVGEGIVENGFVNGRVLYTDGVRMEPGGGLCQLSSTLFNAFLLAGCVIVERHRHIQPVTYVPVGLDAAIKYGKKDLKIKNPYPFNIYIESDMNDKNLTVTIRSDSAVNFKYEIYTDEDETSVPSFQETTERIRQGITVFVFRKKISGSKIVESRMLYKDFYPPVKFK